ncbi:MAG: serine/threonine-protein phosphatase [Clostridia bacterium]|nr:serine/threonine-protein phosphatase [Clostridia bacterium]
MNFIIAADTDIGIVKSTNQDSYYSSVFSTKQGKMAFAVLCDGMGGLAKGEVASSTVVSAFANWAKTRLPELSESEIADSVLRTEWNNIVVDYNEKIKLYGKQHGINLGTTITAILITEKRYYILNVGDTRCYEISNGIKVLTKDQTVVAREVELGLLTEEQAKVDSRRSVLLQCIGASDSVYPDMFFGDTVNNAVYMLCSDGFRHEITEQEIYSYLNPDVMLDADGMTANIRALIETDKQRQERDNITVVAVRTF